jgi:hypothetical protein
MKFKKGAVVNLQGAKLPKKWDVSGYDGVTFEKVIAGSDTEIIFKDKKQARKFKKECLNYSAKTVIKGKRNTKNMGGKILLATGALIAASILVPRACDGVTNTDETGDGKSKTEDTRVGNGSKKDDDTADFKEQEEKVRTRIKINRNKERARRNGDSETLPVETEDQTKAEIEKILKQYYEPDGR